MYLILRGKQKNQNAYAPQYKLATLFFKWSEQKTFKKFVILKWILVRNAPNKLYRWIFDKIVSKLYEELFSLQANQIAQGTIRCLLFKNFCYMSVPGSNEFILRSEKKHAT